jgi:transcription initiation factor IIF auxiliary subunit
VPKRQKNLKVNLSIQQQEFARCLGNLPNDKIEYIDWVIEKVETSLEEAILEQSDLGEAKRVLEKFTLPK